MEGVLSEMRGFSITWSDFYHNKGSFIRNEGRNDVNFYQIREFLSRVLLSENVLLAGQVTEPLPNLRR